MPDFKKELEWIVPVLVAIGIFFLFVLVIYLPARFGAYG
jgi:hypothetical protein